MVNGSRYYRALKSVSIASALSTDLTIYPCQIRVHQRWQSKLQLPTARKKEWRPATADCLPQAVTCQHCDTHHLIGLEPAIFRLLIRRTTSSVIDSIVTPKWHNRFWWRLYVDWRKVARLNQSHKVSHFLEYFQDISQLWWTTHVANVCNNRYLSNWSLSGVIGRRIPYPLENVKGIKC